MSRPPGASRSPRARPTAGPATALHTDEWVSVERTTHLLALALDGLEARSRYSQLDPHVDIAPITWLAADLVAQQDAFRTRLAARPWPGAVRPRRRRPRRPTPRRERLPAPAELQDPDRR
jgi:hypothetical protein